ncbi:hypothetical protein ACFW38_000489 [Salmonella enterica]
MFLALSAAHHTPLTG